MPLQAGERFGPYEILAPLGAGGMGEVYKARDTRLNRTVAVKVLPVHASAREDWKHRFEREARAISSLNHPHICVLYDVGEHEGAGYMVMEHLEGETLLERLKRGALPLGQAIQYGVEIADAMDRAHRSGIVHRDLKPGNIMLTRDGVKVLDFGLAKSYAKNAAADDMTLTEPITSEGTVLGTPQYMAPEQLEGQEADARSDVFAFGCVLYEMVSGKRAFEGKTRASVIAAILEREPPTVAGTAPPALDRALRRCLAKDPEQRWQTARDLCAELGWIAGNSAEAAAVEPAARNVRGRHWTAVAAVAGVLAGVGAMVALRPAAEKQRRPARFYVEPPLGTEFSNVENTSLPAPQIALSPDGSTVVFAATADGGKSMLWRRSMEDPKPRALVDTENAALPFWSSDGRWIAFFSDGNLKRVPAEGGIVQMVAMGVGDPYGGAWGPDGTILLGSGNKGIFRVPASGGEIKMVTALSTAETEMAHRWPAFLPDGKHFLFLIRGAKPGVYLGSLDGKPWKRLLERNSIALYTPPGFLLYLDGDSLVAHPFNAEALALQGSPFVVAEGVGRASTWYGSFSVSREGTLVYAGPISQPGQLTWIDRKGTKLGTVGPEGDYTDFRTSPDGRRVAMALSNLRANTTDIWISDPERGSRSRLTIGGGLNQSAIWSPDGTQVVFRSNARGLIEFFKMSASGGGEPVLLLSRDEIVKGGVRSTAPAPTDWSPDGKHLLFAISLPGSRWDLWIHPLREGRHPVPYLSSPFDQFHGSFSPDGKVVAYTSSESGSLQVHAQTFPLSERKWQISTNGGAEPRWRKDGKELFYLAGDGVVMAVPVGPGPVFGTPQRLFETQTTKRVVPSRWRYVAAPDGQRFLVLLLLPKQEPNPITVVMDWAEKLKQ